MKQQLNHQQKQIGVLIVCDKFKHCLTSYQINNIIQQTLVQISQKNCNLKIIIDRRQVADGGQGSLQILSKTLVNTKQISLIAMDPLFRNINSYYLIDQINQIAYIQMAQISGLVKLKKQQYNPSKTTTFGVGQILIDIFKTNIKTIYLFIGGSATNDAGIGMAHALGYKFYDSQNIQLCPIGQNLIKISQIHQPDQQIQTKINQTDIYVVSDVQNIFYGPNGAAFVYSPQKGADQSMVKQLDKGLQNINEIFKKKYQIDLQNIKGSGAAGGLGGGAIVFLKAKQQKGIQKILDLVKIDQKIQKSDLIITGQGKLDKQSLQGKVIYGVLNRVKQQNKPLWIVCGQNQLNVSQQIHPIYSKVDIISLMQNPTISRQQAMNNTKLLLKNKIADSFIKFIDP